MDKKELKGIWDSLKGEFSELTFIEETHTYIVSGKRLPSVSSLIQDFYVPFDTETEALRYSLKYRFSVEDVKNAWRGENLKATTKGTEVHNFGEDYAKWKYFGIKERPSVTCKQTLAIVQYWDDLPSYMVPVALELQMYNKELGYCGTADILLYNTRDNSFVIADYKTNKEIFSNKNFPDDPLKIISSSHELLQNNFGKYTLQFSFYQILLEEIGLKVSNRELIWLNPDSGKLYSTHNTKDVTKDLRKYLGSRNKDS